MFQAVQRNYTIRLTTSLESEANPATVIMYVDGERHELGTQEIEPSKRYEYEVELLVKRANFDVSLQWKSAGDICRYGGRTLQFESLKMEDEGGHERVFCMKPHGYFPNEAISATAC